MATRLTTVAGVRFAQSTIQVLRAPKAAMAMNEAGMGAIRGRGMAGRLQDAIIGRMDASTHAAIAKSAMSGAVRLDAVSAALLRQRGVEPVVAAVLCRLACPGEIQDKGGIFAELRGNGGANDLIELHPHEHATPTWYANLSMLSHLPAIPHTVATTLIRKPLGRLLSHPALDALGLTIAAIDVKAAWCNVTIAGNRWHAADMFKEIGMSEPAS